MRRLILFGVLLFAIASCAPSKVVQDSRKVIKGYWNLDEISYSEKGSFNVQLFHDASTECFEGSTWRFIPNNNTGVYSIEDADCPVGDRNFVFTIQEVDKETGLYDFLLKPTNEKGKSESNIGYRINLQHLTETDMQWKQTVRLDGQPFDIYMNFTKISN